MIEFLSDLLKFMKTRKNYWMAPILIVLVLIGMLLVVSEGSVIAPFIYTLF